VLQQRYKERAKTKFIKFTDPNDCFSKHLLCWQLHLAPGEEQVERYFASVEVLAESVDPFSYCNSQADKHPLISTIAKDILAIPASSVLVERGLFHFPVVKFPAEEVFLKKNKHFYEKY